MSADDRTPTIGRVVHYRTPSRVVWPAMITHLHRDDSYACGIASVNLVIFNDQALTPQYAYQVREVPAAGTVPGWFWPPRA